MAITVENRRAVEHLMSRIERASSKRNANIGMTLDGVYIQAYLPPMEMGVLELVRESYYRREMTRVYDELKVLGIDLELDFDPSDYRIVEEEITETPNDL